MPRMAKRLPPALRDGLTREGVGLILHLGDLTAESVVGELEAIAPVDAVAGNNDPEALHHSYGRRKLLVVEGVAIGLVHGDGRRGTTLARAAAAFADDEADVILFGHSHNPYRERHGGRWFFNPGSPTDKRRNAMYSYGIVEVDGGRLGELRHDFYPSKAWPAG